jgi:hypothetical protein
MVEFTDNPFKINFVNHRFDHVHHELTLFVKEFVDHKFLRIWNFICIEWVSLDSVLCFLVYTLNSLHYMVAMKQHAELCDLIMISNILSDALKKPKIFWALFIHNSSKEIK